MSEGGNEYAPPEVMVAGGFAGEFARTEDLELASWALERASREVADAVYQIGRAEFWASEAIPKAIDQVQPQVMTAHRVTHEARVQGGGFDSMPDQLDQVAESIATVARIYEEAEKKAYQGVGVWTHVGRGISDAASLGIWNIRTLVGNAVRMSPLNWVSQLGGRDGIADAILPGEFPRFTGLVNRPTAQAFGRMLDGFGLLHHSPYDNFQWGLARTTSMLETLLGEPNYTGVVLALGDEQRRQPQGVADLVQGIADTPFGDHGGVTIDTVVHEDGTRSHVVNIPGTADDSFTHPSPNDWNGNFLLTGNEDADAARMVRDAMEAADIGPDDPVMLSGHSQGGGAAAYNTASEFGEEYNITHVVAFGSAPDRIDVVDDVEYLQVMTTQDPVPSGDAKFPVDLPNMTVAEIDLLAAEDPRLRELGAGILGAHSYEAYKAAGKSVDLSDHLSIDAWRASASDFLGDGETTRRLYTPTFEEPGPSREFRYPPTPPGGAQIR